MITRYGMSDRFGMVALETQNNPYLGGDRSLSCSPQTAADIDQMVVDTVKHGYDTAMDLLEKNQKKLHELAKYLYEKVGYVVVDKQEMGGVAMFIMEKKNTGLMR